MRHLRGWQLHQTISRHQTMSSETCHSCTSDNNPFNILTDNDNDDDTVMASNCSPCNPPPSLPTSDLPIRQPTNRPARQLTIQPTHLPSPCQPSNTPASPQPPRVLISPTPVQAITPTTFQVQIHELHHTPTGSPPKCQHAPSSNPTHSHCGTTEMRCPPRDHPQGHDAPPDSSLIKPPAISHTKPCTTSLALVS
jgi:hypothetical protein